MTMTSGGEDRLRLSEWIERFLPAAFRFRYWNESSVVKSTSLVQEDALMFLFPSIPSKFYIFKVES